VNLQLLSAWALLAVVVAVAPAAGDDPAADRTAKELARFDGNWELTASTTDGKAADLGAGTRVVLVFDGGRMAAVERGGPVGYGTIRVRGGEAPAQIDWRYGDSPAKTGVSQGIYKFDGDTLTICVSPAARAAGRAAPRPARFESRAGSGATLLTYRRVQAALRLQDLNFPDYLVEPPSK